MNLFLIVPKLRTEDEPCGSCFGPWCPDSCKAEQCGECEKGLECKQVSQLREPPKRCKKRTGNNIVTSILGLNVAWGPSTIFGIQVTTFHF